MNSLTDREKHVLELLKAAEAAELNGIEITYNRPVREIAQAYNGIGPEWVPEYMRRRATEMLALFEPAALIHDFDFDKSDGGVAGFASANQRFLDNCIRLADQKYSWWQWRRYSARAVALALYDFVSGPGGWTAWQEACNSRKDNS